MRDAVDDQISAWDQTSTGYASASPRRISRKDRCPSVDVVRHLYVSMERPDVRKFCMMNFLTFRMKPCRAGAVFCK